MIRYVLLAAVVMSLGVLVCHAAEKNVGAKQAVVERFFQAFLSEDEATLTDLCEGTLKEDFRKYFWMKKIIHGEKKSSVKRSFDGKIEIEATGRTTVLTFAGLISEEEVDGFAVTVQGKQFSVAVNDEAKVVAVNEPEKANKASEPSVAPAPQVQR